MAGLIVALLPLPAGAQSILIDPGAGSAVFVNGVLYTGTLMPVSPWDITGALIVGNSNVASGAPPVKLTISDGAKVNVNTSAATNITTVIGGSGATSTGASGAVVVSGENSLWNIIGTLYVGNTGTGTLEILDGGKVVNTVSSTPTVLPTDIAGGTASTGTVTVSGVSSSGVHSTWEIGDAVSKNSLNVGRQGRGTLNITNGGVVEVFSGPNVVTTVGNTGSSVGEVNITAGDGNLLYDSNGDTILDNDNDGAQWLIHGNASIAHLSATTTGTVTVSGDGALWSIDGNLHVGTAGNGALRIENGGKVVSHIGAGVAPTQNAIGNNNTGVGKVTVTGVASTWETNDGGLVVGTTNGSQGTLNIEDGGQVIGVSGATTIGRDALSTGVVTVTGEDSHWEVGSGTLTVSNAGGGSASGGAVTPDTTAANGALNILAGGSVSSAASTIGNAATAVGLVKVEGDDGNGHASTWETGNLTVGNNGLGQLDISAGGVVNTTGTSVIGSLYSATVQGAGAVTVAGADAAWHTSGALTVGNGGNGALEISGGALVENTVGVIANGANSVSVVTVKDADSVWDNSGSLTVGASGKGTLNIETAGEVGSTGGVIGANNGGVGAANVSGGGLWDTTGGTLVIGGNANAATNSTGKGALNISAGGEVASDAAVIANSVGSSGAVSVDGATSTWTATSITVGNKASGTLTIADHGLVDADVTVGTASGVGVVNIGAAAGDPLVGAGYLTGDLTLSGNGTLLFNHNETDAGASAHDFAAMIKGVGAVKVANGVTALSADSLTFTGSTTISSGATLQFGVGGSSGSLSGNIVDNGALAFFRADTDIYTQSGVISGSGRVEQNGGGTTILTGNNTYSGGTTIADGTLQVGNGGGSGALGTGNVVNDSKLVFDRNNTYTFGGVISGSGLVEQSGAGKTILTGENTWQGGTTVTVGTLQFGTGNTSSSYGNPPWPVNNLGGDIHVASGATLAIETAQVLNSGDVFLEDGSILTINDIADLKVPDLKGQNVTIGSNVTLNISGISAPHSVIPNPSLLIDTGAGGTLKGEFAKIVIGGWTNEVDYLTLKIWRYADHAEGAIEVPTGTQNDCADCSYVADYDLSWYDDPNQAHKHGRFTLGDTSGSAASRATSFTVNAILGDTSPRTNVDYGLNNEGPSGDDWDGKTLTKEGDGTLILNANNSYTGDTIVNRGTLQLGSGGTTGDLYCGGPAAGPDTPPPSSDCAIANTGANQKVQLNAGGTTLAFNRSDTWTFDTVITGQGGVHQISPAGGVTILTGENDYAGGTVVTSGALAVNPAGVGSSLTNLGSGAVNIEIDGTVLANTNVAFTFENTLTGNGTLAATNDGLAFNFGAAAAVGNAFNGTVVLSDNTFQLSNANPANANTNALTNATLVVGVDNVTTVGAGDQSIGGLTFDRGTIEFGAVDLSATQSDNHITVSDGGAGTGILDVSGAGTVQVDTASSVVDNTPPVASPLLQQDDLTQYVQLVKATTVTGDASGIGLIDQAGNSIDNGIELDIMQGTDTASPYLAAIGNYGYDLTISKNNGATKDGLYLAYGLTQIELIGKGDEALVLAPGNGVTGQATDLSVKVTGAGDLIIDKGGNATATVSLSSSANDYTGTTTVKPATTLLLGDDHVLGETSDLIIETGGAVDTNDYDQSVGAVHTATGSKLTISTASMLTIDADYFEVLNALGNSSIASGTLEGDGKLVVAGGQAKVLGEQNFAGHVVIEKAAQMIVDDADVFDAAAGLTLDAIVDRLTFAAASGTAGVDISGRGTVEVTAGSDVVFTGDNSGLTTGSRFVIDNGSTMTVSEADNLGAASIANAGNFVVDTDTNWTLANTMSGAGVFIKDGSGNLTISSANNGMSGPTDIVDGILTLTDAAGVGSGVINIDVAPANGGLTIDLSSPGNFANALDKTGTATVAAGSAKVTITGNTGPGFTGIWEIHGQAAIDPTATLSTDKLGANSTVDITANGIFFAATADAFQFANKLTGDGTLAADNNGKAFSFGPVAAVGNAFTGTVALTHNTFALSGDNTAALDNATLELGAGNVTTVGATPQSGIHGLTFDGGALLFGAGAVVPDMTPQATNLVTVDVLDFAAGGGFVGITLPTQYKAPEPDALTGVNLLKQDGSLILTQLIAATTVDHASAAASLIAMDQDGNDISSVSGSVDLFQGANPNKVATLTYGYDLTANDGTANNGLYVAWGLTEIDLVSGQTLILTEDAGATGADNTLSAKVTGLGNLDIKAADTIVISNSGNTWTGTTTVSSGTLAAGAVDVIDTSRSLILLANTTFDTKGYDQTVQNLQGGDSSSKIILDSNKLTLKDTDGVADTFAGTIHGDGEVVVAQGTTILTGDNTYTGGTTIDPNGTLQLGDGVATGSIVGDVDNAGKLVFNQSGEYAVTALNISGSGAVIQNGPGTVVFDLPQTYVGPTIINSGAVRADAANVFSPDSAVTVNANGILDANGHDQTIAALTNGGTVIIAREPDSSAAGVTLTVTGNYVGNNGTVVLRTEWKDDASLHDTLKIMGDASGATRLNIQKWSASNNGEGQLTAVGIKLVDIDASADNPATANTFMLSPQSAGYRSTGRGVIAAGAYDYELVRGGVGGDAEDWYLVAPASSAGEGQGYRPEVGAYLDNRYAAIASQWHTLRDRQHQGQSPDGASNQEAHVFVRLKLDETRRDTGNFRLKDHSTLLHLGGDVLHWQGDKKDQQEPGSLRLGLMGMVVYNAGTASTAASRAEGQRARQSNDGVSLGVYATWYDHDTQLGAYADAWLIGGRFKNRVEGAGLPRENYRSTLRAASLEAGYGFLLHQDDDGNRAVLVPQAQIIASAYRAGNHREKGQTVVANMDDNMLTTRLGLRLYGEIVRADAAKARLRPYAELNWWRGPDSQRMAFDDVTVKDDLAVNRGELKIGIEGQLQKDLTISAWAGVQKSFDGGYSSRFANIGLNKRW